MNRNLPRVPVFAYVTLLLAGCLVPLTAQAAAGGCETGALTRSAQGWEAPDEASRLIEQMFSHAAQVSRSGGTLQAFVRSNQVSWRSHAAELDRVRDRVNAMGKLLCRLQALRPHTAPWQQQTLEHITPTLVNLARGTESAILTLNENHTRLFATDYSAHVARIYRHADQVKKATQTFLEVAKLQERLQQLEETLEAQLQQPSSPTPNREG